MVRIVKSAAVRKQEIIEAAWHLFLTKGYDNTTMQEVMEKVQVAKGTIYYYFKSKEILLEEVISSIVEEDLQHLKKVAQQAQGNGLEKLINLVINSKDNNRMELLEHLHKPANAGMHIRLIAQLITFQAPLYAEVIQQGCEEGVFDTQCPLECAEFIMAATQFLTDMGIYPWSQDQLQRRVMALPGLIETQLKAPAGSFSFLLEVLE